MVVRDLAVDMVGDVSLGDTVRAGGSNPGHYGSEVTKEVTVISRQGTTGECKLAHTIMREEGVGVLQESDQHEPVVDPKKTSGYKTDKGWSMTHTRDKERGRCGRPRRTQTY